MHLAQINIARLRAPLTDPRLADFVANLDPVNADADAAPGFVWRFIDDVANGDPHDLIVNLSVWESVEALRAYTYASRHLAMVRRRREWFERMEVFFAMWWIAEGHIPTIAEGRARLAYLAEHGSTRYAFTFSRPFNADGTEPPAREWPPHTPRGGDQPAQ